LARESECSIAATPAAGSRSMLATNSERSRALRLRPKLFPMRVKLGFFPARMNLIHF
jgi:hypothetical protein